MFWVAIFMICTGGQCAVGTYQPMVVFRSQAQCLQAVEQQYRVDKDADLIIAGKCLPLGVGMGA